jgi:hypothetical protein
VTLVVVVGFAPWWWYSRIGPLQTKETSCHLRASSTIISLDRILHFWVRPPGILPRINLW